MPRSLYAGSTSQEPWPLTSRTDAWKPIGVTSRAMVLPGWSSETPDQVPISGCAAASLGSMAWVRWTANRSKPPVGVGTRNDCRDPDLPATGALRSVAATRRRVDLHDGVLGR